MTHENDAYDGDDETQASDYTRGDRFAVNTDPSVEEVVVLDTMTISGYEAVLLAEKDAQTGEWADAYPNKAQYLTDEQALGMVEERDALSETDVSSIEGGLRVDGPSTVASPEGVTPVASLDD